MDNNTRAALEAITKNVEIFAKGIEKSLNQAIKDLPKEQAEQYTEALKNAGFDEKTQALNQEIAGLKNAFKQF